MASALDSLDTSLSHFVGNEKGLSELVSYEVRETGILSPNLKATRQFTGGSYVTRKIVNGKIVDYAMFLITLSFTPSKNDKLITSADTYYVDKIEPITPNNYRLYCIANSAIVPSPTKSIEL